MADATADTAESADRPDGTVRTVLLVVHTRRDEALEAARHATAGLVKHGIRVRRLATEMGEAAHDAGASDPTPPDAHDLVEVVDDDETAAAGCELVLVLGGDGTILRGAQLAHPQRVPVLGVNLGHVGFLAEAESYDLDSIVRRVVDHEYAVEQRLTLRAEVTRGDEVLFSTFAVNEISVEKAARERMLEVLVQVDGRPLSRWGCDGVVCATPTGSTAYAFSAGGPVVWPEVEAVLVVPLSAHALFARAMVVAPNSPVTIDLVPGSLGRGVVWADGRRSTDLPDGARVVITRDSTPTLLARLDASEFTSRLVAKFDLPVHGWRGRAEAGGDAGTGPGGHPGGRSGVVGG